MLEPYITKHLNIERVLCSSCFDPFEGRFYQIMRCFGGVSAKWEICIIRYSLSWLLLVVPCWITALSCRWRFALTRRALFLFLFLYCSRVRVLSISLFYEKAFSTVPMSYEWKEVKNPLFLRFTASIEIQVGLAVILVFEIGYLLMHLESAQSTVWYFEVRLSMLIYHTCAIC